MSLPTDLEIKSYLRISTDVEDLLIFGLNQTAQSMVGNYLGVPLATETRTFAGRFPRRGPRLEATEQLTVPVYPCDTTAVVTDLDGATVDAATYTIDQRTGELNAVRYACWNNPPYSITIDVGLAFDPNYDAQIDPLLRQAVFDLASDLWNRRNPGAVYEQSGGQVSITYTNAEMPERTRALLDGLRSLRPW